MLDAFKKKFVKDAIPSIDSNVDKPESPISDWKDLVYHLGGCSFNQGLYRVIRAADEAVWNARVAVAFPDFADRITCFGFDWLGRVFALDSERIESDQAGVVMFELGTGETLEVPCSIASFHDEELIEYGDAALAIDFHRKWINNGGAAPNYNECVGYKEPLFLGGVDDLCNLELIDIDIYWHLMGQLVANAKGLPPGTPVSVNLS